MDIRLRAIMCIFVFAFTILRCFFFFNVIMNNKRQIIVRCIVEAGVVPPYVHIPIFVWIEKELHKMKSDPANKMSDQVHLKTNQRVIFTGVYRCSPAMNQSQPSHEPPVSALLAYASIKKAGFYTWSVFWLVRSALQSFLTSGSAAPPNGKQRRLNLSLREKKVKGETKTSENCLRWVTCNFRNGSSGKLQFHSSKKHR